MKKEIRIKRNELRDSSIRLKSLAWEQNFRSEINFKIREEQDKKYKRYKFYDGYIKASDKEKEVKNDRRI